MPWSLDVDVTTSRKAALTCLRHNNEVHRLQANILIDKLKRIPGVEGENLHIIYTNSGTGDPVPLCNFWDIK